MRINVILLIAKQRAVQMLLRSGEIYVNALLFYNDRDHNREEKRKI